jgi:hypothetical protein
VENVGVDLQWAWPTRDQVHLPALIGGNPLNQGAVGPTTSVYISGTWTKVHPCQKKRTLLRRFDPLWCRSSGMHHFSTSSSSKSAPPSVPVWQQALRYGTLLPWTLTEQRLKIYIDLMSRNPASSNHNRSALRHLTTPPSRSPLSCAWSSHVIGVVRDMLLFESLQRGGDKCGSKFSFFFRTRGHMRIEAIIFLTFLAALTWHILIALV